MLIQSKVKEFKAHLIEFTIEHLRTTINQKGKFKKKSLRKIEYLIKINEANEKLQRSIDYQIYKIRKIFSLEMNKLFSEENC